MPLPAQSPSTVSSPSGKWLPISTDQTTPLPSGALLFKNAAGKAVQYVPPSTPPTNVSWKTYNNQQEGFSVDYPDGWVVEQTSYKGHEGLAVYPPGTDPNADVPGGAQGIGFGWADNYQPPPFNYGLLAGRSSLTIDGIQGESYTVGGLGYSVITAFPYKGGYFVLGGNAGSDVLIYVYQHMLSTLRFR